MTKMWRRNGEEQKFLENLFRIKEVNHLMKPSVVQLKYPMFQGFSSAVFRKHFTETKLMFDPALLGNHEDEMAEIDGAEIPPLPATVQKMATDYDVIPSIVEFKQPPVTTSVFSDPETKQLKCLIVVLLFSEVKKVDFDVIQGDNEQLLKITYAWPKSSFEVSEMFKKDADAEPFVNRMHPKFLSVEVALQAVRENFEEAPIGTIEVKLPIAVQLEPSTWKQYFNRKRSGSLLVFFEFLCHRNEYIIKKAEKSLSME